MSDHARYEADGTPVVHSQREVTVINRAGLNDLGRFARAIAGALWALDFMHTVAEHGGAGVNIETDVNHLAGVSH